MQYIITFDDNESILAKYISRIIKHNHPMSEPQDDEYEKLLEPIFVPEDRIEGENVVLPTPVHLNTIVQQLPGELVMSESEELLRRYLDWEGFGGQHHIEVYDNWVGKTAAANVSGRALQLLNGNLVFFENLHVQHPSVSVDGQRRTFTPKRARELGVTYGTDWYVNAVVRTKEGIEVDRKDGVHIGLVPTMTKSQYCVLHKKTPRELAELGEDPHDPGGYFIVKGTEKTVMLQEQLAVNRILSMNMGKTNPIVIRLTASTAIRGTALIELALDKSRTIIKVRFPSLRSTGTKKKKSRGINALRVFRLLGVPDIEQIKSILALFIGSENKDKALLKLTRGIVDFSMFDDDVSVVLSKYERVTQPADAQTTVDGIIESDLFPHLNNLPGPDGESVDERKLRVTKSKIFLLSIMVARFLEILAGVRALDNRDSWSNKRVEGAGRMMENLFRNAWRKTLMLAQDKIQKGLVKDVKGIAEQIQINVVTDTFHDSFNTSKWGVKGSQAKNNVAQTLTRDSVVATFAHINTVDVAISRTDRTPGPRLIQNSQWNIICPVSTPEGENAGIVKNLALTAKVTTERSDTEIIRYLIGDVAKKRPQMVSLDHYNIQPGHNPVIINGKFLGWGDCQAIRDILVSGRRHSNQIGSLFHRDMTVLIDGGWLYVDTGPSRLVAPYLVVNPQTQKLVIDELGVDRKTVSIEELFKKGAIEYLSSWEMEYIKCASRYKDIQSRLDEITKLADDSEATRKLIDDITKGLVTDVTMEEARSRLVSDSEAVENAMKKKPYTHCLIDPLSILGVAAALIPWPNHNQAPRNTYQTSMGKQALGIYHSNHKNRMDGKTKVLAFPTRATVETDMYGPVGLNERSPGENINIAFMAFPFTEEDSFVVKKEFLDNGGFRIYKYLTYKTVFNLSGDIIDMLVCPDARPGEQVDRYKYIHAGAPNDTMNGLPKIGAPLRQGDCIIGKVQINSKAPAGKSAKTNGSIFLRVGDDGVVDSVIVTSDNKTMTVTVKLRVMRVPQEGDKFAPRNAQKGTIGLVMREIDLPFDADGVTPDFIINPACMPSRMTLEYLMELIGSKAAAYLMERVNGTAFKPFELNRYREVLKSRGKDEYGYEQMRSGTSGKLHEIQINAGPINMQALRHHVKDKIQARNTGMVEPMTRQPPKGRGNNGGLRFGEMERDAGISHGASAFITERLKKVSDGYPTVYCRICGTFAVNDATTKKYKDCPMCGAKQSHHCMSCGEVHEKSPGKDTGVDVDRDHCKICLGEIAQTDPFGRLNIPYVYKLLVNLLAAMGFNLRPEFLTSDEIIKMMAKMENDTSTVDMDDVRNQLKEGDEVREDEDRDEDEKFAEDETMGLDE